MRFILVDEILDLVPGRQIRALKRIEPGEDFFRDHFPGFPVVPGVLLTEMMAQAAGKCLVAENPARGRPMLVRINSAVFRHWVAPGTTVQIAATIRSSQALVATADGKIHVDDRLAASAELVFGFVARDKFAPDYRDEVLERYLARPPRAA